MTKFTVPDPDIEQFRGTTILSARRGRTVALGGDGQVTLGNIVIKSGARKVRRLYHEQVLAGFAGGTADAFTLFERFEGKLEKPAIYPRCRRIGQGLAHRPLPAPAGSVAGSADRREPHVISGNGDVIEPEQT